MGLRHALEADHLAAVASLSARATGRAELLRVAGAWGVGHAATIVGIALLWVATGVTVSASLQPCVEVAAGALLIWLGVDLLRRREGGRARLGPHAHRDGTRHAHLHWEGAERRKHGVGTSSHFAHPHPHPRHPIRRALFVGAVHGVGGSAILGLLASHGALPGRAIAHAVLFGVGATVGMLALSSAVSVPLRVPRVRVLVAGRSWRVALACASIAVGVWVGVNALRLALPTDFGI